MDKQKAKVILNWLLFAACVAGSAYVGFVAPGLTITERIVLASTSLGGLFVAMGGILPRINKAIDDFPTTTTTTTTTSTTTPVNPPTKGSVQ
jgi:hypothetical protein